MDLREILRSRMGTTPHGDLPPDLVLTVEEASAFLKLDVQTVRALARSGDLPAVKLGKQWRFLRHRLIEALEPRGTHQVPVGDPQSPTITQRDAAEVGRAVAFFRVVDHFADEHAAVFVEREGDGIADLGFEVDRLALECEIPDRPPRIV